MLQLTTFGSGKAALRLAEILNEYDNPMFNRRVTNFLVRSNKLVKAIESVNGRAERLVLASMLTRQINEWKPQNDTIPEKVITFTKNVALSAIKSRIYDMIEDYDSNQFKDWLSR